MDLLVAYTNGLVLGGLILSTLILFPGRNNNNHETIRAEQPRTESIQPSPDNPSESDGYYCDYWTPHRRLNFVVYVILIGFVVAIWCAAYATTDTTPNDGVVRQQHNPMTTFIKILLRTYFPREANLLLGEQPNR
jgi:hypothetical protein